METGGTEQYCYVCIKNLNNLKYLCCKVCANVYYCNNSCKAKCMEQRIALYESISWLLKVRVDEMSKADSYQTLFSIKEKPKIAKRVGDIFILQYSINYTRIPFFMDTGAQVSIIKGRCLSENFLHFKINPVQSSTAQTC